MRATEPCFFVPFMNSLQVQRVKLPLYRPGFVSFHSSDLTATAPRVSTQAHLPKAATRVAPAASATETAMACSAAAGGPRRLTSS